MDHAAAHAARTKLYDEVYYGRMTPEEAEAEAANQGLEPLRREPDVSRLDPMTEPVWTLAMAVAWIVWRTPEVVRESWVEYTRQCHDWHWSRRRIPRDGGATWEVVDGWELKQRECLTLALHMAEEALEEETETERAKLVSVQQARDELWNRLLEGALTATATRARDERPVRIPSHEWPYLLPTADRHLRDELRFARTPLDVQYQDVTLSGIDVCKLWKAQPLKQTIAGERGCQAWLEHEMRNSRDVQTKPKSVYLAEASERFHISKRAFDRAWGNAIGRTGTTAWGKAGRPKNHRGKITVP